MTALPARRRRRTIIAGGVAVVLVALAAGLTAVGADTVINSTAGATITVDPRPVVRLPDTDNAALAVVDQDNQLTSLVVVTLLPSGAGGSIVTVPVNADSTVGFGDVRVPLDTQLDPADPAAFFQSVAATLSISLQFGEIVDADRLEALLAPVESAEVDLPFDVVDSADVNEAPVTTDPTDPTDPTGAVIAEAGDQTLDASMISEALRSIDVTAASVDGHANDVAVWTALARNTPIGTADVVVDEFGQPTPSTSIDEVFARLWTGPVQVRDLALQVRSATVPPLDGVDAVVLDRRDVLLVFSQISPTRVSTPNPGPVFRIEVPLADDQITASDGLFETRTELGLLLIEDLLFLSANVVSFDGTPNPDAAPAVTRIEVADERFMETMRTIGPVAFGEVEVVVAEQLVDGVDVVIRLGTAYIDVKRANAAKPNPIDDATVTTDG